MVVKYTATYSFAKTCRFQNSFDVQSNAIENGPSCPLFWFNPLSFFLFFAASAEEPTIAHKTVQDSACRPQS